MPEISIIVPVYKVEDLLDKCVNSILNQTFRDFELILVDDGSPDNCGKMCDEYAKKDSRIRVIHRENGGLSAARNSGLDVAVGKYIGFVDSDDYIHERMYEQLYNNITKHDADVACCGITEQFLSGEHLMYEQCDAMVCDAGKALGTIMQGKYMSYILCCKLFKASCLEGIRFIEGKLYEDIFFTVDYIQNVSKMVIDNEPLYYYYRRGGSITTSAVTQRDYDLLDAYGKNIELVNEKFPELKSVADFRYFWSRFVLLDRILLSDKPYSHFMYKELVKVLRKNTFKILKIPYFRKQRHIGACVLKVSVPLYRYFVKRSASKEF
ncbi:MAG: glycosyltransferase [Clostridia bacterium]|nr:glycosyltransferase [Clostridia bacterium]